MIGSTISHYKILEKLGEGGMGIVYKAQDLKLKRTVAIKFLPQLMAENTEERERFQLEAEAASALNHPNVATIYEIDQADGQTFIVMEYVEGKTIRELSQPLPIKEALDIGVQMAEGLAAAHETGIVHRDIKAENVMVRKDGRVQIMDFGLAKMHGVSKFTKEGSTVGTISYMSPEQTQGLETDQRTDIFSLGVLLFELLTGRLPFAGGHETAVMYEILNVDPPSPSSLRNEIHPDLERIVLKCLEKNREERYQSAKEIAVDLKHVRRDSKGKALEKPLAPEKAATRVFVHTGKAKYTAYAVGVFLVATILAGLFFFGPFSSDKQEAQPSSVRKLAVLPFKPVRTDPETDFLGFSLADQIITKLNYVKALAVRPSDAVRQYERIDASLADIARALDVEIILTGSFLKHGDRFRLNAQLVNIGNNEVLWSEALDVKYADIFTVQDSISKRVVDGLSLHLSADESNRLRRDIPSDPLAYEYFLKATGTPRITNADKLLMIELLEKSLELDPNYAPTWTVLGNIYGIYAQEAGNRQQYYERAEEALHRALKINNEFPPANSSLAHRYPETGKVEEATELMLRSLSVNPNTAEYYSSLGYICRYSGLLDESVRAYQREMSLDSGQRGIVGSPMQMAKSFIQQGFYSQAAKETEKVREIVEAEGVPFGPMNLFYLGFSHYYLKNYEKAFEAFNSSVVLDPGNTWTLFGQAYKQLTQKNFAAARENVKKLEDRIIVDSEMNYRFVHFYSLLGDTENAVKSLERSVDGGFFNYPYISRDPLLEDIRSDKRYQHLLIEVKSRHEAYKSRFAVQLDEIL
ncbi:MAG: protein kinase [Ignavibacteriales bacterium]|nr:protein kinase [Ignavibacteriales bacterium]